MVSECRCLFPARCERSSAAATTSHANWNRPSSLPPRARCTLATWTGRLVVTPDLKDPAETRWPILVHNLRDLPVRAVIAVPLTALPGENGAVGSLDLHSTRPHGLDDLDPLDIGALAAILTVAVLNMTTPDPNSAAIATMVWPQIQRATGMVAQALGVPAVEALDRLRVLAFLQGRWLSDVAEDVVSGRHPADLPDPAS